MRINAPQTVQRLLVIDADSVFRLLSDICVEWETYNVDPNHRRRVEECVRQGDAPSPEQAEGSQPVGRSGETIQEGPERKDGPRSDGTGASTPKLAVIMDKTLEAF